MLSQEKAGTNVRPVHFSTSPLRPTERLQEGEGVQALFAYVISTGTLSHLQLPSGLNNQLDSAYPKPQQKEESILQT